MSWKLEKEKLGKEIICSLYERGMIKTWYRDKPEGWVLISGIWSPFYIQLRPLSSYPKLLKKIGYAMGKMIKEEAKGVSKVVGVAMAGLPIATAIALCHGIPSAFARKLEGIKTLQGFRASIGKYGEHTLVEGDFKNGDKIIVVDDLVTKFDSKLIVIEQVKYEVESRGLSNVICRDVGVLIDREQGACQRAKEYGISLYSLIPFETKGLPWLKEKMSSQEYQVIMEYLEDPKRVSRIEHRESR